MYRHFMLLVGCSSPRRSLSFSLSSHPLYFFSQFTCHFLQPTTSINKIAQQHKNLLKYSKGYRGRSKNCFSVAIRRVEKAWQYGYRDRRTKKREWRKLWIMRIQAGVRQYGYRYSAFIPALNKSNIELNRKVLADIAANEPFAFKSVMDTVKAVARG